MNVLCSDEMTNYKIKSVHQIRCALEDFWNKTQNKFFQLGPLAYDSDWSNL